MAHVPQRWLLVALLVAPVSGLVSQDQLATQPPSRRYRTNAITKFLLGSNWRDVWGMPVVTPVLNLDTFGGGLVPFKAGGNQSRTLRFRGGDSKTYVFRSTDKFINRNLDPDLRDTPAANFISDQASAFYPSAQLVTAPLQAHLGLLQTVPQLVIMPDDPKLGEYRKEFAGLMGQIEMRPEGEDGKGTSFEADAILDSEKLLEKLDRSLDHRVASEEYLAVRFLDFILGDTDRSGDNWRWAEFREGDLEIYRPVPRDRDYAFMVAGGLSGRVVRAVFPKFAHFSEHFSPMRAMTNMSREFDRSQLSGISKSAWDSVASRVVAALPDAVIDSAVRQVPLEEQSLSSAKLIAGIRARRDGLLEYVREFYGNIFRDVDIFASNENDLAEIVRGSDGSVVVRLFSQLVSRAATGDRIPAFERRYIPQETSEIRVYMQGGNDKVIIRGAAERSILVRITGGAGDDSLIDSSHVARGGDRTIFYDAHGKNSFVKSQGTRVDEKPYVSPVQPAGEKTDSNKTAELDSKLREERRGRFEDLIDRGGNFVNERVERGGSFSGGKTSTITPKFRLGQGVGLITGLQYSQTQSAFRHNPYQSRIGLSAEYGTGSSGVAAGAFVDLRRENSHLGVIFSGGYTQLETNRFYGYGNTSDTLSPGDAIVYRRELHFNGVLRYALGGSGWIAVGPLLRSVKVKSDSGTPGASLFEAFNRVTQAGLNIETRIDHRDNPASPHIGYMLRGSATYFPAVLDLSRSYTTTHLEGRAYLPLWKSTLAFRIGGTKVFSDGPFPLQDAAFIGGSHSLRGFVRDRFAGDAEANATAELRIPLVRVTLLTRGNLGVFGFGDAGRVWVNGASPGSWHQGFGGGLSFVTLGNGVSVAYGRGNVNRFYIDYGFSF